MPVNTAIEEDIRALRTRIRDTEAEEQRERAKAEQVLAEAREAGDQRFTPEWMRRVDEAYIPADKLRDDVAQMRAHLDRLLERHAGGATGGATRAGDGRRGASTTRAVSVEELAARTFVESEMYQRALADGTFHRARIGDTAAVEVMTRREVRGWLQRATPLMRAAFDENVGGALIPIDQQVYPPVEIPVRQVQLLDLITVGETNSDQVKWSFQTLRQDAAAAVPYGAPAPEAAFAYAPVTTSVERLAAMVPATKDQLADQAQTQTLLENQLRSDVLRRLEYEVLAGTGTNSLLGILNGVIQGVGILSYARLTTGGPAEMPANTGGPQYTGPEYALDAIHKAITLVRINLFGEPTAVGLNPTNQEGIILQKDAYGRYLIDPGSDRQLTIWGLPVVTSTVFPTGTGVVADWKRAYTLWLRAGLQIYASDGYMDFFTRGMVAILVELRAAGTVTQPRAACEVTGL